MKIAARCYIAGLALSCLLSACDTPPPRALMQKTTSQYARNNAYSLLYQLLNQEKDVSKLRFIKREDEDSVQRILEGSKKEDKLRIIQFRKKDTANPEYFDNLEDLLADISKNDLECTEKVRFIYSGNNEFPFDAREQWTDSCNLLALKEGVVLGYDRNDKTVEAFKANGFKTIKVNKLLQQLENKKITIDDLQDILILMPSSELSRARGGFHCMSMPLLRDEI